MCGIELLPVVAACSQGGILCVLVLGCGLQAREAAVSVELDVLLAVKHTVTATF